MILGVMLSIQLLDPLAVALPLISDSVSSFQSFQVAMVTRVFAGASIAVLSIVTSHTSNTMLSSSIACLEGMPRMEDKIHILSKMKTDFSAANKTKLVVSSTIALGNLLCLVVPNGYYAHQYFFGVFSLLNSLGRAGDPIPM